MLFLRAILVTYIQQIPLVDRFIERIVQLYEQESGEPCDSSRLRLYFKRWLRWVWAGFKRFERAYFRLMQEQLKFRQLFVSYTILFTVSADNIQLLSPFHTSILGLSTYVHYRLLLAPLPHPSASPIRLTIGRNSDTCPPLMLSLIRLQHAVRPIRRARSRIYHPQGRRVCDFVIRIAPEVKNVVSFAKLSCNLRNMRLIFGQQRATHASGVEKHLPFCRKHRKNCSVVWYFARLDIR